MAGLGYQCMIGKGLGACEMVWQGLLNKEIFFSLYRTTKSINTGSQVYSFIKDQRDNAYLLPY